MKIIPTILACTFVLWAQIALATSNYEYGDDEYVTVMQGTSPDGKYAITTHGKGELGTDDFHVFLTDAVTGKKIGPLTEVVEYLDTDAHRYAARWAADSQQVEITYLIGRQDPLQVVSYRIAKRRAFRTTGPKAANKEQEAYWENRCGLEAERHPERLKTFGTPKAGKPAGS